MTAITMDALRAAIRAIEPPPAKDPLEGLTGVDRVIAKHERLWQRELFEWEVRNGLAEAAYVHGATIFMSARMASAIGMLPRRRPTLGGMKLVLTQ
jgi:hypothetical protein